MGWWLLISCSVADLMTRWRKQSAARLSRRRERNKARDEHLKQDAASRRTSYPSFPARGVLEIVEPVPFVVCGWHVIAPKQ